MVKLTKAIIKKYGITKKAWAVARGSKKKVKVSRSKKVKTRSKNTMAKRKRSYKKSKSKGFKMPSGLGGLIGAVGYGFIRERASEALANTAIVQRLPVTDFTDEGVMLAANWGMRKAGLGKIPVVNSILRAQKTIELARVGQTFSDLQQKKSSTKVGLHIN